jgi:Holliday junction resolvase
MTEADLSKRMVTLIRNRGGWAVKTHGDPRQRRGLPDIIASYRSQFIGLEVKLPGRESTLTPLQADTLEGIRKSGGLGAMATSVPQVEALLQLIDRYKG